MHHVLWRSVDLTATTTARINVLAVELNRLIISSRFCGGRAKSIFNFTCHSKESLFDISRLLSGSLNERNTHLVSILLCDLIINLTASGEITFVSDKKLVYVLAGITVNLTEPNTDVVEGFSLSDIIDDNNTMGTTVIRRGDSTEAFLTSSIPKKKRKSTKNQEFKTITCQVKRKWDAIIQDQLIKCKTKKLTVEDAKIDWIRNNVMLL